MTSQRRLLAVAPRITAILEGLVYPLPLRKVREAVIDPLNGAGAANLSYARLRVLLAEIGVGIRPEIRWKAVDVRMAVLDWPRRTEPPRDAYEARFDCLLMTDLPSRFDLRSFTRAARDAVVADAFWQCFANDNKAHGAFVMAQLERHHYAIIVESVLTPEHVNVAYRPAPMYQPSDSTTTATTIF